jgi:hypothetical protein
VDVQWDGMRVRLLDPKSGTLLREHRKRARGRRSVHPEDVPARTPPSTLHLLERTRRAGKAIGTLCDLMHVRSGEAAVRRILGLLALAKKHGVSPVEDACGAALELGIPEYRFVRRWIERHPPAPLSLRQVDPLIRQLSQYRELVSQITSSSEAP